MQGVQEDLVFRMEIILALISVMALVKEPEAAMVSGTAASLAASLEVLAASLEVQEGQVVQEVQGCWGTRVTPLTPGNRTMSTVIMLEPAMMVRSCIL